MKRRKMRINIFVKYLSLILFAVLMSSSSLSAKEPPYIVVSVRTLDNEYYHAVVKGAKMFAESIGAPDKLITLFCEGSSEKQVDDLRKILLKTKQNAIFYFDPNESPVAERLAKICKDAGVYFSTQWNKPSEIWPWEFNPYWVTHSTPDGMLNGYKTGKELCKALGGKGKVLALQGRMGNTIAIDRFKGFKKALQEYPDITLLDVKQGDWSRLKAMEISERWFSRHMDVKGVWAANDEMALGALEVIKSIGRATDIKITGIDGTGDAIRAIIEKEMLCTVSPDPYWQSAMSLSFAYKAYKGEINPADIPHDKRAFYIDSLLVDQENALRYLNEYINGSPEYNYQELWKNKWRGQIREY